MFTVAAVYIAERLVTKILEVKKKAMEPSLGQWHIIIYRQGIHTREPGSEQVCLPLKPLGSVLIVMNSMLKLEFKHFSETLFHVHLLAKHRSLRNLLILNVEISMNIAIEINGNKSQKPREKRDMQTL